ncbi:hypothetical protein CROQUDRAFT_97612 [Cronartium quercuum f. sp. fusiforme G11]|uniref:Uncharacterized protein n=1 Tax=Cronartium quercuum f. sp. fusiforme G11 TaxID=708437 RepID=A0A9P6NE66_9BASI|nr:hypothetical protein CROQUDRAFT_97612 [Cronartium quercuum f. sp. fusiforme G11]
MKASSSDESLSTASTLYPPYDRATPLRLIASTLHYDRIDPNDRLVSFPIASFNRFCLFYLT